MKSKGGPSVSRPNAHTYNRSTFVMALIQFQLFRSPLLRIVISYIRSSTNASLSVGDKLELTWRLLTGGRSCGTKLPRSFIVRCFIQYVAVWIFHASVCYIRKAGNVGRIQIWYDRSQTFIATFLIQSMKQSFWDLPGPHWYFEPPICSGFNSTQLWCNIEVSSNSTVFSRYNESINGI